MREDLKLDVAGAAEADPSAIVQLERELSLAPAPPLRRHVPLLLYGALAFCLGIAMYLAGVLMVFPRYLLGLNSARPREHQRPAGADKRDVLALNVPGGRWYRMPIAGIVEEFRQHKLKANEDEGAFASDDQIPRDRSIDEIRSPKGSVILVRRLEST